METYNWYWTKGSTIVALPEKCKYCWCVTLFNIYGEVHEIKAILN